MTSESRNTPLQADDQGITRWIDKEYSELAADHYARELIVNARDAGATEVRIDGYHHVQKDIVGIRFSDNGSGMTAEQLVDHARTLLKSGNGRDNNFGIGGRLATLPANNLGVCWASRARDEDGHLVENMIVLNKSAGYYGIVNDTNEAGELVSVFPPAPGMLDRIGSDTGTAVILLGNGQREVFSPEVANRLRSNLGRRFYKFGLSVMLVRTKGDHNQFDGVPDYSTQLKSAAGTTGTIVLDEHGTTATWWVMGRAADRPQLGILRTISSLSVLHEGELFDFVDSQAKTKRWGEFGLSSARVRTRVAIVITPGFPVEQTHNRARITPDIPWDTLSDAFFERMPAEIEQLRQQSSGRTRSLEEEVLRRITPNWIQLLEAQPRSISDKDGEIDANLEEVLTGAAKNGDGTRGEETKPAGPVERAARRILGLNDGITKARPQHAASPPDPQFVTDDEWTTEPQFFVDYNRRRNSLFIRKTCEPFQQVIAKFCNENPKMPSEDISDVVLSLVGIHAVEQVMHILSMSRHGWTPAQVDEALEPAALSAGLLGITLLDQAIRHDLRNLKQRTT
jgi:hypothetical protein